MKWLLVCLIGVLGCTEAQAQMMPPSDGNGCPSSPLLGKRAVRQACIGEGCQLPVACKLNSCVFHDNTATKGWTVMNMSLPTINFVGYGISNQLATGLPLCPSWMQQPSAWVRPQ